jgi:rhamnulokinase
MWLYERCRKEWIARGERLEVKGKSLAISEVSHPELQGAAMQVEAFRSIIDPDNQLFANPPSMVEAIRQYCRETGQQVPETPAEICRCIFDSLALRYRQVFQWLKEFASFELDVLHVIGGGSLNKYLNQFTADALGVEVLAGPQEGTAIGNIMMQAKSAGEVSDIWEMRRIIAASIEMVAYHPTKDKAAWDAAFNRYLEITKHRNPGIS